MSFEKRTCPTTYAEPGPRPLPGSTSIRKKTGAARGSRSQFRGNGLPVQADPGIDIAPPEAEGRVIGEADHAGRIVRGDGIVRIDVEQIVHAECELCALKCL